MLVRLLRWKLLVILGSCVCLLGANLPIPVATEARGAEEPCLLLTFSSAAATYTLGDPILLTVRLENLCGQTHTVSAFSPGSLSIALLTRDGTAIEATQALVSFADDPFLMRAEELTPLPPGERLELAFDVAPDVNGDATLEEIELREDGIHAARTYSLARSGSYLLQLRYQYTGPDEGLPSVFHGELLSNQLAFELQLGTRP